jgi:hypothetical protein
MHYMIEISHRLHKHKFDVTCPYALFIETALVPPEHQKYCVDVSSLRGTGMHYMTCRYHRMQKHKFRVRSPNKFVMESILIPPEEEK